MRRWRRRTTVIALAVALLSACGAGEAASTDGSPSTVGDVGKLPDTLPPDSSTAPNITQATGTLAPTGTASTTPITTNSPTGASTEPDAVAHGNKLFVLGDSIMEATTTAFGGEMCKRLVPQGWSVEIDAQQGRDAAGGLQAVQQRLDAGETWDAAVVLLGNNYRDDPGQFDEQLGEILDRLSPAPVLLLTVTEFEDIQTQVNDVIRREAAARPNVTLLDWAARTAHDDSLVGEDGLHLTDQGKVALVAMVRLAVGDAPAGSVGECRDG